MGIYSWVVLMAMELSPYYKLVAQSTSWYQKDKRLTFSGGLRFVKQRIWLGHYFCESTKPANQEEFIKIAANDFNLLINQLTGVG